MNITVDEWIEETKPDVPCGVKDCTERGVDRHHIAPGSVFGKGKENWPTVQLCKRHHRTLHVCLDGYRYPGMVHIHEPAEYRQPRVGQGTDWVEIRQIGESDGGGGLQVNP